MSAVQFASYISCSELIKKEIVSLEQEKGQKISQVRNNINPTLEGNIFFQLVNKIKTFIKFFEIIRIELTYYRKFKFLEFLKKKAESSSSNLVIDEKSKKFKEQEETKRFFMLVNNGAIIRLPVFFNINDLIKV